MFIFIWQCTRLLSNKIHSVNVKYIINYKVKFLRYTRTYSLSGRGRGVWFLRIFRIHCMISFRFVSFLSLHILFRFVSQFTDFVSFRFVSFRFVVFRFVSLCFVSVSFLTLQGPKMHRRFANFILSIAIWLEKCNVKYA